MAIVLERPITVAPAPTDAPSCELQITAQMVRGNLELRAGEELGSRWRRAIGTATRAAARRRRRRRRSAADLAPPKRKEEEPVEAAPAKADADDDEAAAADALAKAGGGGARQGERAARSRARRRRRRRRARRRAERGRHPPRSPLPLVESGDFDLLVHHGGGEPPALVKATRLRVLPATIDVPEATLRAMADRRARAASTPSATSSARLCSRAAMPPANRVPRVGLTIGTELAATG